MLYMLDMPYDSVTYTESQIKIPPYCFHLFSFYIIFVSSKYIPQTTL